MLPKIKPMMLVRPPNAILHEESFWDEMIDAGINEIAIQWLCLLDDRGDKTGDIYPLPEDSHPRGLKAMGGERLRRVPVAPYQPNPELYKNLNWQPPEMPSHLKDEAKKLRESLKLGVRKGFKIYAMDDKAYFLHGGFGTGQLDTEKAEQTPSFTDSDGPSMTAARTFDTISNFPEISGLLLDGPDFKWEITPGHRDDLWVEPMETQSNKDFSMNLGMDFRDVLSGREKFQSFLQNFGPENAKRFIKENHGALADHNWWSENENFSSWYKFKQMAIEWNVSTSYTKIKSLLPELEIGNSSRLPMATTLTGHNLIKKRTYTDFQMPKEYWWSGGVAGFRGTVMNWVKTLMDWNPGLDIELASDLFSAMFDYPMPKDYPVTDYNDEATDEWFSTSVRDQTEKMMFACQTVGKFVPWVGLEHYGSNWVTPFELDRMLVELRSLGATRYCYFVYNSLSKDYWNVIRKHS